MMGAAGGASARASEVSADFADGIVPLRAGAAGDARASESLGEVAGERGGDGAGLVATATRVEAGGGLVLISLAGLVLVTGLDLATGLDSATALDPVGENLALASPFDPGKELARGG
jgi:hypothetical protein